MEEPLHDLEDVPNVERLLRRDPLHRTQRLVHTRNEDARRDLQRVHEQAEFDEAGYLNHRIDEELLCLDCDCNFGKTMAGQCLLCSPHSRLCPAHFFHCQTCGRGLCTTHATVVTNLSGKHEYYCPKHGRLVRAKRFVRATLFAVLAPVLTNEHRT